MRHSALVASTLVGLATAQAPTVRYFDPVFTPTATTNVSYGSNTNPWTSTLETLKLDVYEPQGDTETARPAYVHVHGGGFYQGAKSDAEAIMVCQTFASLGYVAFSVEYRRAPTAQTNNLGPATCAEDVKAAIRFVRANATTYRVDPLRVACGGDDAGGTGSLLAAFTSWSGNSGNPGPSHVPNAVLSFWASNVATPTDPRVGLALVHGTVDSVVPYGAAQSLAALATSNGVRSRVVPVVNGGHACWERWDSFKRPMWGTVYEYLHLWERTGLTPNPDYATTLRLDLCMTGWESNVDVVFASPTSGNIPFEPFGVLQLNPATLLWLGDAVHRDGTFTDKVVFTFNLPSGVHGSFFVQHAGVSTTNWWLTGFSNLVRIDLP